MANAFPPCSPFGDSGGESDRQGGGQGEASDGQPNRRTFLRAATAATAGTAAGLAGGVVKAEGRAIERTETNPVSVRFSLNGEAVEATFDSRTTLLDLLRERMQLTGTKKGCDHGSCGACTVHLDGRRVLGCLTLAATLDGTEVTTIEGLADGDELHPVQSAFLRCDAYQCGYCTPGQIMSAVACTAEGHADGSPEEVREWMSGNLCRCGAYPNIVAAVRQHAGTDPEGDPSEAVVVMTAADANELTIDTDAAISP